MQNKTIVTNNINIGSNHYNQNNIYDHKDHINLVKKLSADDYLYIHIPFCRNICNYCDFAKTSDYNQNSLNNYLKKIVTHLQFWNKLNSSKKISTIYFGGGTPGLFSNEYTILYEELHKRLADSYEWTLECNPNDINENNLKIWRDLGVNRLSIGVQSFCDKHLKFLSRDHNSSKALSSIELAKDYFEDINVDLMYAIVYQTKKDLVKDLDILISKDIFHISIYHLSFEPQTPLYRSYNRNKFKDSDIANSKDMYKIIRQKLASSGYIHEELGNFSKNNFSCQHNWVYWLTVNYIAAGSGAHGYYVNDNSKLNNSALKFYGPKDDIRYYYSKKPQNFKAIEEDYALFYKLQSECDVIKDFFKKTGANIDKRTKNSKLWEIISSAIRTKIPLSLNLLKNSYDLGINLNKLKKNSIIKDAIKKDLLYIDDNVLKLDPELWLFADLYFHEIINIFEKT